ncbi:MAG: DUF1854 domain-containing protein [Burkholderiales bacterium]|nr:DUF1854 domain-containing protein [Burkholderiales bacterium]
MEPDFDLQRDAHGRLVLTREGAQPQAGVVPVRSFPLSAPEDGLSLVGADGRELAWIERPQALPPALRALLEQELAAREFAPEILRIVAVSTFATPSTWTVDTDRGRTRLVLKGEEDIRRLGDAALLVTCSHGIGYRVRDRFGLDRGSRRLLERFL